MASLAEAFLRSGQDSFTIRRLYAQALMDLGRVSVAIPFLKDLAEESRDRNREENFMARGLLGRAFKQLYVDAGVETHRTCRYLEEAIGWYYGVFEADRQRTWHGINCVALLSRAYRDGVELAGFPEPQTTAKTFAKDILEMIMKRQQSGDSKMWDYATAVEACVALKRDEEALGWLERYVSEPASDAFELASSRRQLVEVWQLEGGPHLTLLEAELLRRQGGGMEMALGATRKVMAAEEMQFFEKVLGKTRYVSLKDLNKALSRARAVGRVEDQPDNGFGTGFLVRGGDLHEALGDELLFLTNSHVVSDDPNVLSPSPLLPDEATVTFQMLREEGLSREHWEYEVEGLLWTSPPGELDASLLRLARPVEGIEPYPVAPRLPLADGEQRVYIVGHPKGGTLSFSIQDNQLIDHEGPPSGKPKAAGIVRLHYRAPTEGGSSGSPVFNRQWKLIGLHHAGGTAMPKLNGEGGTYAANEGIWIRSIIEAMKEKPPA